MAISHFAILDAGMQVFCQVWTQIVTSLPVPAFVHPLFQGRLSRLLSEIAVFQDALWFVKDWMHTFVRQVRLLIGDPV